MLHIRHFDLKKYITIAQISAPQPGVNITIYGMDLVSILWHNRYPLLE